MSTDLIVIGAGYWGTAVALAARQRGWTVEVLDDGDPEGASRASAGLVRWSWLNEGPQAAIVPDWWDAAYAAASEELVVAVGGHPFRHWLSTRAKPEPRAYADRTWMALPTDVVQMAQPIKGRALRVGPRTDGEWPVVVRGQTEPWSSERVAICAGVWTDPLLEASGFRPLGVEALTGSALVCEGALSPYHLRSYMTRPYHHLTARWYGTGRVHVGSTVTRAYPDDRLNKLLDETAELFPQLKVRTVLTGLRPVLDAATVEPVAPGLVAAAGGGRIGLALAGGVARRVVEELL